MIKKGAQEEVPSVLLPPRILNHVHRMGLGLHQAKVLPGLFRVSQGRI